MLTLHHHTNIDIKILVTQIVTCTNTQEKPYQIHRFLVSFGDRGKGDFSVSCEVDDDDDDDDDDDECKEDGICNSFRTCACRAFRPSGCRAVRIGGGSGIPSSKLLVVVLETPGEKRTERGCGKEQVGVDVELPSSHDESSR